MELLVATGEVLKISRSENEDIFLAAALSLGSLGIILTVTLQCEPAFRLCKTGFSTSLHDVGTKHEFDFISCS